ncbi:hypothetical protein CEXT_775241 [Caerostris extrusa]|uniref:Ycf1 n=1 Tax=Caerostris extrusa TaxID=172846 RepID=A0AAV4MPC7_CAEEX|nr:hypothetical protein CEXT_775241 [Caerostris extrusa]
MRSRSSTVQTKEKNEDKDHWCTNNTTTGERLEVEKGKDFDRWGRLEKLKFMDNRSSFNSKNIDFPPKEQCNVFHRYGKSLKLKFYLL